MLSKSLTGLRVLILEDEFLIAMDVEQLCRDSGAEDVAIVRDLDEFDGSALAFDVAILDLMLNNVSTLDFAKRLFESGIPFVFASGHSDLDELAARFPGVAVVRKPYGGEELVGAVATAANGDARRREMNP